MEGCPHQKCVPRDIRNEFSVPTKVRQAPGWILITHRDFHLGFATMQVPHICFQRLVRFRVPTVRVPLRGECGVLLLCKNGWAHRMPPLLNSAHERVHAAHGLAPQTASTVQQKLSRRWYHATGKNQARVRLKRLGVRHGNTGTMEETKRE